MGSQQAVQVGRGPDGGVLRGELHLPEGPGRVPAALLLHGFTGHRAEEGFVYVRLARALADDGIGALRLDFRGSGESDGDFADVTIEGELADAEAALSYLAAHPRVDPARRALVGCSLGSTVAALLAGRSPVAALVLWAPLARPGRLFAWPAEAAARAQLERGEALDVGERGCAVRRGFFESAARVDPVAAMAGHRGATLAVRGERDYLAAEEAALLLGAAGGPAGRLHEIAAAGHVFAPRRGKDEAIAVTRSFLRQTLQPAPGASS